MRVTARAIILNDDKVLLIHRLKNGKEYYSIPGGGVEDNESFEEAVIREIKEECNVEIKVLGFLGNQFNSDDIFNLYHCEIISGTPTLSGEIFERSNDDNFYDLVYININELESKDISCKDFIKKAINKEYTKLTNAILTDEGICPTCYDKAHDNIIFGNYDDRLIHEDSDIECFLVGNPRADGHMAISTKEHYKDMSELPTDLLIKVTSLTKLMMNAIKYVYNCESVYLCSMCDGPMNHFHNQLIPRYDYEKRGSSNFVKDRKVYIKDEEKIIKLKEYINKNII